MSTIIKKELNYFFSTVVGYIVIALFLITNMLFLWVLPGQYNILDSGYASVDGLFVLAPWLFLFLCPAITMRMVAEERQTGTIETMLTKPVSVTTVVVSKWVAASILVLVSLLPTLVWYVMAFFLAEPVGNVDGGAFWGSWIGLAMLAMLYSAIGLLGSSLTKSQIVAFVASAAISFLMYYGFELAGSLLPGRQAYYLQMFGIDAHYKSIARGVLDSRDIVYYLAATTLFLWLAIKKIDN